MTPTHGLVAADAGAGGPRSTSPTTPAPPSSAGASRAAASRRTVRTGVSTVLADQLRQTAACAVPADVGQGGLRQRGDRLAGGPGGVALSPLATLTRPRLAALPEQPTWRSSRKPWASAAALSNRPTAVSACAASAVLLELRVPLPVNDPLPLLLPLEPATAVGRCGQGSLAADRGQCLHGEAGGVDGCPAGLRAESLREAAVAALLPDGGTSRRPARDRCWSPAPTRSAPGTREKALLNSPNAEMSKNRPLLPLGQDWLVAALERHAARLPGSCAGPAAELAVGSAFCATATRAGAWRRRRRSARPCRRRRCRPGRCAGNRAPVAWRATLRPTFAESRASTTSAVRP